MVTGCTDCEAAIVHANQELSQAGQCTWWTSPDGHTHTNPRAPWPNHGHEVKKA